MTSLLYHTVLSLDARSSAHTLPWHWFTYSLDSGQNSAILSVILGSWIAVNIAYSASSARYDVLSRRWLLSPLHPYRNKVSSSGLCACTRRSDLFCGDTISSPSIAFRILMGVSIHLHCPLYAHNEVWRTVLGASVSPQEVHCYDIQDIQVNDIAKANRLNTDICRHDNMQLVEYIYHDTDSLHESKGILLNCFWRHMPMQKLSQDRRLQAWL